MKTSTPNPPATPPIREIQTRQDLSLGLLITFRIIKALHLTIKITLIFLKIRI